MKNAFLEIISLMRAAECVSIKIKNAPYMPLCVEFIGIWGPSGSGRECVSFCHYGEKNGDLMRDLEVCFEILPDETGLVPDRTSLFAYEYRNDYAGFCSSVFDGGAHNRRLATANEIKNFARMWAKNLAEQGFIDAARAQLSATETTTATAAPSNG